MLKVITRKSHGSRAGSDAEAVTAERPDLVGAEAHASEAARKAAVRRRAVIMGAEC
jgi:hypothetical protein